MYNESRKRASMKYMSKLKEIRFRVRPEYYDKICQVVSTQGYASNRQFFLYCIDQELNKYYND